MQFSKKILGLATRVISNLAAQKSTITTVESCTGGLIAAALTTVPGSSSVVYGGFVTYANEAKSNMVGVNAETLQAHGAVSDQIAREMAEGGLRAAGTDCAVAVTGIAGPDGGSAEKPVGLVFFAVATSSKTISAKWNFGDVGREEVREMTVLTALEMILELVQERP
jgi:nicotinamide-nucleotide amidase